MPDRSSDRIATLSPIPWEDWSAAAFDRAARERKPVLLSIGASWCHGCSVMDRTTFSDPSIAEAIRTSTVPVRVDADRRPDVNERYNLDGWPTTALLTPSGEILTGSTYVTPDVMPQMLAEATGALRDHYEVLMERAAAAASARRAKTAPMRHEPDLAAPDWVAGQIAAEHDAEHGGFGTQGKFLQTAALRFALDRATAGDARFDPIVLRTLDAMTRGGIIDAVDGGFFRYAAERDWSRPHTEKMLEDQAAMATLFAEAADLFSRPDYRACSLGIVAYVRRTLADTTRGGFFASQRADDEFYTVSGSIRETLDAPPVDRTLFTDGNAQAAVAWLGIGERTGTVELGRLALASMEHVLLAVYRPGDGVAHWAAPTAVRGLLTDQVHAAWALLHMHAATGNDTYSMLAEELMRTAIRTMWDADEGGFLDHAPGGPDDVGMLRDATRPLALNCLAARVLTRLAALTAQPDLQQLAIATLASQTAAYRRHGIGGAPYATAVEEVLGT